MDEQFLLEVDTVCPLIPSMFNDKIIEKYLRWNNKEKPNRDDLIRTFTRFKKMLEQRAIT